MRTAIRKMSHATNVIDHAYLVKGRSMAVKPNIVLLMYALVNDENLSQSKLRNEWLLPLSTINTIVTECRNSGYLTLEPIPGKRRECFLHLTKRGKEFADLILAEIHTAEEKAMRETVARFSPEFVEALDFYAKKFHSALNLGEETDEE